MMACSCWRVETHSRQVGITGEMITKNRFVCNGTKEREECTCGGDPRKCDFYPEKRRPVCEAFRFNDSTCTARKGPVWCPCDGEISECPYPVDPKERGETMSKKEKVLNTAQMWLLAQEDGKTYCSRDLAYSKEKGFHPKMDPKRTWPVDSFCSLADIFACEWTEFRSMSRAEAEKALGVTIVG